MTLFLLGLFVGCWLTWAYGIYRESREQREIHEPLVDAVMQAIAAEQHQQDTCEEYEAPALRVPMPLWMVEDRGWSEKRN